jgi:hypothetical protein
VNAEAMNEALTLSNELENESWDFDAMAKAVQDQYYEDWKFVNAWDMPEKEARNLYDKRE